MKKQTPLILIIAVFFFANFDAYSQNNGGNPNAQGGPKLWQLSGNPGTNSNSDFLGTTDTSSLVIKTNAVEQMRITSGGNVGIGIKYPLHKLDIAGTTRMTGFQMPTNPFNGYVLTTDANGIGTWQPMQLNGINTSTTDINFTENIIADEDVSVKGTLRIGLNSVVINGAGAGDPNEIWGSDGDLHIQNQNTGNTVLNELSGNVGIGRSNPNGSWMYLDPHVLLFLHHPHR